MTLPGVNHLDIWGTVLGLKLQAGGHDKVDELTLDRLGGGAEAGGAASGGGPCSVHRQATPIRQRGRKPSENFRTPLEEAAPHLLFPPQEKEESAGALEKLPSRGRTWLRSGEECIPSDHEAEKHEQEQLDGLNCPEMRNESNRK